MGSIWVRDIRGDARCWLFAVQVQLGAWNGQVRCTPACIGESNRWVLQWSARDGLTQPFEVRDRLTFRNMRELWRRLGADTRTWGFRGVLRIWGILGKNGIWCTRNDIGTSANLHRWWLIWNGQPFQTKNLEHTCARNKIPINADLLNLKEILFTASLC